MSTPYLSYWLLFVGILRSISVVLGYVGPQYFRRTLFTQSKSEVTALQARTFAIWTFITCALSVICSQHLHERGIYIATCASFYAAAFYFTIELLVYRTVRLSDWTIPVTFAVAGISSFWMTTHFGYYHSKLW